MTYDMIVVGAGPGGIALAAEAIIEGIDKKKILVLEKADKNSWIIRKLYPEQKLVTANYKGQSPDCKGSMSFYDMTKEDTLGVLSETADKHDINVVYETNVFMIQKKGDIFEIETNKGIFKTKVCAIAIGIFGKPNKPSYPIPAAIRKQTSFDITSSKIENKEVLVVGGGDSASEYTQHLVNDGNKLTLSCRTAAITDRMNDENAKKVQDLSDSGVINLYTSSDVTGIEEEDGRIKTTYKEECNGEKYYDHIVYALGGTTPSNFLKVIGVEIVDNEPEVDECYESNVDGLFIIGDLGAGRKGGSIILAFNSAVHALERIKDKYVSV